MIIKVPAKKLTSTQKSDTLVEVVRLTNLYVEGVLSADQAMTNVGALLADLGWDIVNSNNVKF